MKKKLLFKLFIFAVIGAFVTVTSCKDYDDDISRLDGELSTIKADYASKIDALKTELNSAIDAKVKTVSDEVTALKTKVTTLETNAATKADIDAAKAEILGKVVALEVFNTFKTTTEAELTQLKADLAKAATKEELDGVEAALTTQLGEIQGQLEDMGVRVGKLESDYAALLAQHEADVADLIDMIADAKAELGLEIDAVQAALDAAEGRLDAKIDALDADLREILAEQLAKIEANATAIAAVAEDLQEKYDELVAVDEALQEQITQNANDIAALILRVKAIEEELPKIKQSVTDLETKLNTELGIVNGKILSAYRSLDNRVYTLTYIPDYTSDDGTPQIVVRGITEWQFKKPFTPYSEGWEIKNSGKIYKGISILRYKVSPSNVKYTDFEIEALLHKVSLIRAADTQTDPIVLAGAATLEGGVLSVPVAVAADNYNLSSPAWDGENHNVSVALQVKNLNAEYDKEEDRLVTSTEYVKANFDLSEGRIALNEKSLKADGTILPTVITYTNIAGASYASDIRLWNGKSQSGSAVDVLDHTIDLNEYIYGVFDDIYGNWEELLDFGFDKHTFVYRLVNLESEGTDQSANYVTLDPNTGVIGVKPAGTLVNQAAVGRTPVVEVKAVVDGVVHAVGYIKIIITDDFDSSAVTFEFNLEDYVIGCNSVYGLTDVDITAIDFDQVFNHARIQLGKDQFFQEYSQGGLTDAQVVNNSPTMVGGQPNLPGTLPATVGVDASKHVWFEYAINPATQSVNLFNYLEGNIRNDAPVGTYKVVTTLKSNGSRPDVVITWNFKVVLPSYSLTAYTPVLANGKIVVNPTILEQGGKTSTAYESLLNNAFVHSAAGFTYTPLPGDCDEALTPYFVFTSAPSGYHIASNGVEILENGTNALAARIDKEGAAFYVRLNVEAGEPNNPQVSWGNFPPLTDASKGLVGTDDVKIQPRGYINGVTYNHIALYNPFNVEFIYPLEFALPTDAAVYDQANNGNHVYSFDFYDPNILIDWNGKELDVTTADGRALIEHYEVDYGYSTGWTAGYWQPVPYGTPGAEWVRTGHGHGHGQGYWAIWVGGTPTETFSSPFDFDLGNLKSSVKPDGTIDPDNVTYDIPYGTQLKINPVAGGGVITVISGGVTYDVPSEFVFEWNNGATGAIQNAFKIAVPVSVKHKWGVLSGTLIITVNPGSGPAPEI